MADRFGVPESVIYEVVEKYRGTGHKGCVVPTEADVATQPAKELIPLLVEWIWESPIELAPTREGVLAVAAVLEARPDAKNFDNFVLTLKESFR